jgi:hypothetical protein
MDRINEMFRRQIMQSLFGKVDEKYGATYSTTNSIPASNENPLDAINKALEAVKKIPQPQLGTLLCSFNFFVDLLLQSNATITSGYKTGENTWHFELDSCTKCIVTDIVPVDDRGFNMKNDFKPLDWERSGYKMGPM